MQALQPRNIGRLIKFWAFALAWKQGPYANMKMAVDPPRNTDLHCIYQTALVMFTRIQNKQLGQKVIPIIGKGRMLRELPPPPMVIFPGQLVVCRGYCHYHSYRNDTNEGSKQSPKAKSTTNFQIVQVCIDIVHPPKDKDERQKAPKEHLSRCLHVPRLVWNPLILKVCGGTS